MLTSIDPARGVPIGATRGISANTDREHAVKYAFTTVPCLMAAFC